MSWGAGTRAAQYLVLGAKARALLAGRNHATVDDIQALVHPTLRHRILVGYRAEAEGVTVENVIGRLLETVQRRKQMTVKTECQAIRTIQCQALGVIAWSFD